MTRDRLEGLPLSALLELSRKENLDFDPDASREDLIEELLDAYEEDQREREKLKNLIIKIEESKFSLHSEDLYRVEPDPVLPELSESYDDDTILLFLRDPTWALAVWEVRRSILDSWAKENAFRGFGLKVLEKEDKEGELVSSFLIPLSQAVGTRYVHLPTAGSWYQLELHALFERETRFLARSASLQAPFEEPPYLEKASQDAKKKRLLELSGLKLCEPYQETVTEEKASSGIPQRVGDWDESAFEEQA